jgi:hypothetical protein
MPINLEALPSLIAQTKQELCAAQPNVAQAFAELSAAIQQEVQEIQDLQAQGVSPVPTLPFAELRDGTISEAQRDLVRKRGCVVVRGVFTQAQCEDWNAQLAEYIESNDYYTLEKKKRGLDKYFSQLASDRPQIFGLYWSKPQMQARQSEELAQTRQWLNRLWNFQSAAGDVFNPDQECLYADRIRRRQPGDNTLGLSPHVDGGSVERWIDPGYRNVYRQVFAGNWQQHNPFDAAFRTSTEEIPSPAVCQMFRTYQGWTALTPQGPGDGTLQLVPLTQAMSWILLRALQDDVPADSLCNAQPGRALSVTPEYHQLLLDALVPIPEVNAGDTVWWHPDVIHAVEDHHTGSGYSNVMYIGAAPDCAKNRDFLPRQAEAFQAGRSCPDFAPEDYEVGFVGRATVEDLTELGKRQMGML